MPGASKDTRGPSFRTTPFRHLARQRIRNRGSRLYLYSQRRGWVPQGSWQETEGVGRGGQKPPRRTKGPRESLLLESRHAFPPSPRLPSYGGAMADKGE